MKILLVNFGAYGDILNSTPIAKHYKLSIPNCQITWMTLEKYKSVLLNNPFIDKIITVQEHSAESFSQYPLYVQTNFSLKQQILELKYDKIFFVAPYDWTINNSHFDVNKHSLLDIIKTRLTDVERFSCEFIPTLYLSGEEINEAKNFYNTLTGKKKILVEHENFSNQSPFSELFVDILSAQVDGKNYDIIFSGKQKPKYLKNLQQKYKVNYYNYSGSFTSNAELYNLCDVFVGCCSGLTCLTHADYCDRNKIRIEVSNGIHWSSKDWVHMINKTICYNLQDFISIVGTI